MRILRVFTAIFLNTFRLQSLLAYAEFPLTRASFQSTRTYGKVTLHCLQMRSTYNFSIKNEFHMFFLGQCRSSWPRVLLLFSCLLFAISWRMVSIGGTVHRSFTQVTSMFIDLATQLQWFIISSLVKVLGV